ncbi:hypothetical protein JCM10599A_21080 [Paraburkholderia kururiensis]
MHLDRTQRHLAAHQDCAVGPLDNVEVPLKEREIDERELGSHVQRAIFEIVQRHDQVT